ncbi:MAG: hypothetical protein PHC88_15465 [Terrimicrobiaceae bacterium]|nr:hypothetical protein [Terrimicrobiaceae bacterium]
MNTTSLRTLIGTLLAAGFMTLPAMAAKVDFSDFRGHYSGLWTLFASSTSAAGNISANVSVPKNGSKMDITINGLLSVSGSTVPIQTSLHFTSKHKLKSDAVLMGFDGPILTLPASFSGSKQFAFTQTASPGATLAGNPISGTVAYTLKFSKSGLSIQGTGSVSTGSSTAVVIVVHATKKKHK